MVNAYTRFKPVHTHTQVGACLEDAAYAFLLPLGLCLNKALFASLKQATHKRQSFE